MFDHLGLTVSDLDKSKAFYAKVLAPFGYALLQDYPGAASGFGPRTKAGPLAQFWIAKGNPPPQGPRIHVAFATPTRKGVDDFYAVAMAAGAVDNGKPGVRAHYHEHYYGAFVIDPDGYNIEAVCHAPPGRTAKKSAPAKKAARPASRAKVRHPAKKKAKGKR